MFITPAFAQSGGAADLFGGPIGSILPFILIFVIMYFLIIRPQQQRAKTHREMVQNVRRGDTIVTSGGIIGKVTKLVDEKEIQVEIAENTRVRITRGSISEVVSKGEPVKEES
jgi:preprotein translocase subunit YajC